LVRVLDETGEEYLYPEEYIVPNQVPPEDSSRRHFAITGSDSDQSQTLINTVNCVGIMGKGIALEFKERFPDMVDDYVKRCERKEVKQGR
jgi:hypothetical protein